MNKPPSILVIKNDIFLKKLFEYRYIILIFFLGLMSFLMGAYFGWTKNPEWFSRFGSLMVLFGAMAEYQLGMLPFSKPFEELTRLIYTNPNEPQKVIPEKKNVFRNLTLGTYSHLMAISGTLIWGFGDKLLSHLKAML